MERNDAERYGFFLEGPHEVLQGGDAGKIGFVGGKAGSEKEDVGHGLKQKIWPFFGGGVCCRGNPPAPPLLACNRGIAFKGEGNRMGLWERNHQGLSERDLMRCCQAWTLLTASIGLEAELVTDGATRHYSETVFRESDGRVYLGANVLPGCGTSAIERLSVLACLAHELAHLERFRRGFRRPLVMPDLLIDEAETSLHASFYDPISKVDRETLVEHAHDLLEKWLYLASLDRSRR